MLNVWPNSLLTLPQHSAIWPELTAIAPSIHPLKWDCAIRDNVIKCWATGASAVTLMSHHQLLYETWLPCDIMDKVPEGQFLPYGTDNTVIYYNITYWLALHVRNKIQTHHTLPIWKQTNYKSYICPWRRTKEMTGQMDRWLDSQTVRFLQTVNQQHDKHLIICIQLYHTTFS